MVYEAFWCSRCEKFFERKKGKVFFRPETKEYFLNCPYCNIHVRRINKINPSNPDSFETEPYRGG
jgi:hypothetical protein